MTVTRTTRSYKGTRRLAAGACAALAAPLAMTLPAGASTPQQSDYAFTAIFEETHNCGFTLEWQADITGTTTDHFDQDGNLIMSIGHGLEQDTVTGPGGTLVGDVYNTNIVLRFDATGDVIGGHFTGHFEKIRLPDGSLFSASGLSDATTFQGGLVAQNGTPADVGRLCEVLGA